MKFNLHNNYFSAAIALLLISTTANLISGQENIFFNPSIDAERSSSFRGESAPPMIATEKKSYNSGELVVITGKGYNRFEKITLTVEFYNEALQQNTPQAEWEVFADGGGEIFTTYNFNSFSTPSGRSGLIIKATGGETGAEAQTSVAASVDPVFVQGNPSCETLNADNVNFPTITSNFGFKVNVARSTNNGTGIFTLQNGAGGQLELTGGAPSDPNNSVTTNVSGATLSNWAATMGVDAVIVKGGPNANVFVYNPESTGDTNLVTPDNGGFGVSHVEFCYDYEPGLTIIKQANPQSPQDFSFTPSGTGAASNGITNFTLDDDGDNTNTLSNTIFFPITNFGANNPITITEDAVPMWNIRPGTGISCTQTGPGSVSNNTINIPNRSVTIVVEEFERVTCRFINELVLAAGANISGKINVPDGISFRGISLVATALSTGERFITNSDKRGNYLFEGLPVNENYLITIKARNLRFEPESKFVSLDGDLADIDFTASVSGNTRSNR